jgi:hypothetical protein
MPRTGLWLLTLMLAATTAHAAGMTYPVYRTATPIVVDGDVLGDPAWQTVPALTGFFALGGGYTQAKQTTARMAWDGEALYVGVVCEEPDAAQLKPAARDYGQTWTEDSLELFVQPGSQVYQIGVTAGGAKGQGEGEPDLAKITAAAKIAGDSYSLEVRITYGAVQATTPRPGDKWRGEVCRNTWTTTSGGDKYTAWTPLQGRFLEPANYATLAFIGETLDRAQAEATTRRLNDPYQTQLAAEVKAAAAQGGQYVGLFKQAATDAQYGAQVRQLLAQWEALQQLSQAADHASTFEMRAGLLKLQTLSERSYQVKYQYLMNKLLTEN